MSSKYGADGFDVNAIPESVQFVSSDGRQQWFVVWPDGSQTDPFFDQDEAATYAMQHTGATVEGPFPIESDHSYIAHSGRDDEGLI